MDKGVTKDGREVTLVFHEQDPTEKPLPGWPWIVHRISAMMDGREVGHLKIGYIPQKKWDALFPTAWHAMKTLRGWAINLDAPDLWKEISRYKGYYAADPSPQEKKKLLAKWEKETKESLKDIVEFHVDKPLVDYILVGNRDPELEKDLQKQGIGTMLYQYGAKKMAQRGLALWASGLQSDEAKASWASMERRQFPVVPSGGRRRLDYRGLVARVATKYLRSVG